VAEQRAMSPFAASMALYSGHLRNRVTQAYTEAQAMMAQQQMSEQEQRKTWLAMYKADMANIKALRAQIPRLQKAIEKENLKTDKGKFNNNLKIRGLILKATEIRVQAREDAERIVNQVYDKVDDQYDVGPEMSSAIAQYANDIWLGNEAGLKGQNWESALKNGLGIDVGQLSGYKDASRSLKQLVKEFEKIQGKPKAQRAYDQLIRSVDSKLRNNGISKFGGTDAEVQVNKVLAGIGSKLSTLIEKDGDLGKRIDDAKHKELKNKERDKEAKRARSGLGPAWEAAVQQRELKKMLKDVQKDLPAVADELTKIVEIKQQIGDAQRSADALRANLMAPSKAPQDIREVVGGILTREDQTLEQIAMQRAKQRAIALEESSMPAPFKKFLGHLMGAKKYKEQKDGAPSTKLGGQWVTAAKYVDAMMEQTGSEGQPLNIAEMYDQVARDIPNQDLANKVETIATARILDAWNQGKEQRDKESKAYLDVQKNIERETLDQEAERGGLLDWDNMTALEKEAYQRSRQAEPVLDQPYNYGEFDWSYMQNDESPFWRKRDELARQGKITTIGSAEDSKWHRFNKPRK